ncbi:TrkH family potassium uptake protein [Vallitalea guaymasensis]|uniref:TrkH family potassium uptake protein n=1 Tax=Vallitalea guaymasensis TaxID=1185412 RepID=A0A8J8M869_9FIRM|nr:TrkH family potassium uptake protein [Vallitalea guaymasensis]QUH28152.1 TrkH family potassium uptake protein [Vallitalea guaymasensis]
MKKMVIHSGDIGKLILLVSLFLIIPLLVLPFYPENVKYIPAFLIPALISAIFGIFICAVTQSSNNDEAFTTKRGSVTVLFIWLYSFFIGALPFVLGGQLTFVQALFESVSGWTTTGLSTMDVREVPKIYLFYRSFMQYCGGLGFVMVMVMLIQGKQAMSLYSAEGHSDQLVPNLGRTARTIFLMYMTYLLIGTSVYVIFGMSVFDAVNHAMCALSTGGFSTQYDSIGAYDSIAIEAVTIFLMIIGTTNFAVLLLLSKRKFKRLAKVSEVRFLFVLLFITVPFVAGSLASGLYISIAKGFRLSVFNIVSALSTSGFSTMSYVQWPAFSIGMMILLMIIGGGIGSTAGGLKLTRVYLMYRITRENIKKRLSASRTVSNPYFYRAQGKTFIDKSLESDTVGFIFLYIVIFVIGSLLITLTASCSLSDAMFEFASSLGTVGLSIGLTGPTTNNMTLFIEMIGMLLGRLEIFIVIIGINSSIKQAFNLCNNKNTCCKK